ncbi:MAG: hypothetical protein IJT02_05695 [Synergistaceae bacterium]|nr:hypothetical protein [Synergistaceae bacterium]
MLRINVSDLALCQRCPALLGYKIHMGEKDAWKVGIKGSGHAYGSMFHKNIARMFFEAASDSRNPLHAGIVRAVAGGRAELEEFVRGKIFMPFVEKHSGDYTAEQIMAAARGVTVWVKAMAEFFAEIPSLVRNPEQNMRRVFLQPETKLQSWYDFPGEGRLVVRGCYDALMFNPDKAEARLFEFKGYSKSDLAVPLSQSLVYAWLIARITGIVPSVEIIYLDDGDKEPDVFSPSSVKDMIRSGLPGLFHSAFSTITLRRLPEILRDKDLCKVCRFKDTCAADWAGKFRKRPGASMINVLVFFLAAMMIMAQVFFFARTSQDNLTAQVDAVQQRVAMDKRLSDALELVKKHGLRPLDVLSDEASFRNVSSVVLSFAEQRIASEDKRSVTNTTYTHNIKAVIYDLAYTLSDDDLSREHSTEWDNNVKNPDKMIFPPVKTASSDGKYYLVRVFEPHTDAANDGRRSLMYQVLVHSSDTDVKVKSFHEFWY